MQKVYGDVPKWLKGPDSKSGRRRKACGGSNPSISASSEIPATVPFPPYGESYTLAGISSLSSDKRFSGLPDEEIGCDAKISYLKLPDTSEQAMSHLLRLIL